MNDKNNQNSVALTQVEQQTILSEVERIFSLQGEWEPTYENLVEFTLRVKEAALYDSREKQQQGIEKARQRGVSFGRPKKIPPKNFTEIVRAYKTGKIIKGEAAAALKISKTTFDKWLKEYQ